MQLHTQEAIIIWLDRYYTKSVLNVEFGERKKTTTTLSSKFDAADCTLDRCIFKCAMVVENTIIRR